MSLRYLDIGSEEEHLCSHLQDALTDVSFPLKEIKVHKEDDTGKKVPIPDSHVHKV